MQNWGRLWGTGDTKTSCGKEGSQPKELESEVEGLKVVVWDAVEMARLVVKSMVMFSCTHALQGFWIWIKEGGRESQSSEWQEALQVSELNVALVLG